MKYEYYCIQNHPCMNKANWERMLKANEDLTKAAHVEQFIPSEELNDFHALMTDVLSGFIKEQQQHIGLKVFVEQERNREAEAEMMKKAPTQEQGLEAWGNEIFQGKKFGIILNNLEKYSNPFSVKAAKLAEPLLEMTGLPLGGLATLCFLGNYGFTPFGIHKENRGEEGFLMHFGPGEKVFYTWDTEEYLQMSNGSITHPIEPRFLDKATAYTMKPGDAFFVPSNRFHIAQTEEFSLSMVLDYFNPIEDTFKQKLLAKLSQREAGKGRILETTSWQGEMDAVPISLDHDLESVYQDHILSLRSNGGFIEKTQSIQPSFSFMEDEFVLLKPFQIFYKPKGEKHLNVFVRGHEQVFPDHGNLRLFLDKLNHGDSFGLSDVQSLMPQMDVQEIFMLLSYLQMNGGLEAKTA